jgi:hypothetical protein
MLQLIILVKKHFIYCIFLSLFINQLRAEDQLSNFVKITEDQQYRYIESNNIPDHNIGKFPNKYNPNKIREQKFRFRIALHPKKSDKITYNLKNPFGIALNGVLFDPWAAEFWQDDPMSGWNYNPLSKSVNLGLDKYHGHIQPNGAYHYHALPNIALKQEQKHIGYAADGFPIYALYGLKDNNLVELKSSYQLKKGARNSGPMGEYDGSFVEDFVYVENSGDLDQCNGYHGKTPEYPEGTYYYVLTKEFPYIPRCFMGYADASFNKKPHHHPNRRGGPKPRHFHPHQLK